MELLSHSLNSLPEGQPPNLPKNVAALPMRTTRVRVDLSGFPGNHRSSVIINMTQLPFRPANALTSYSAQGKEFESFVIYETHAQQLYAQLSRGTQGLESVIISSSFNKKMVPSKRIDVLREMERLEVCAESTFNTYGPLCGFGSSLHNPAIRPTIPPYEPAIPIETTLPIGKQTKRSYQCSEASSISSNSDNEEADVQEE